MNPSGGSRRWIAAGVHAADTRLSATQTARAFVDPDMSFDTMAHAESRYGDLCTIARRSTDMFPHNLFANWLTRLGGATRRKPGAESASSSATPIIDKEPSAIDLRLQLALEENRRLVLALQAARHSVGNQLALLAALLARQSRAADNPEIGQALQTAQLRVHAVAAAMRPDTRADGSEFVSSKTLVERAVEGLLELASNAGVEIEVDVQDFRLRRNDAFSYMLIISELAVNSLKHAFPDNMGGAIRVRFTHDPGDEAPVLMIEDNGVGRTDDPARAGLGSTVIGSAVQNLGAKLLEESCRADGERRGLRTTISRPHSRLA